MARPARMWPAAVRRSTTVSPERSSVAVRVSETVRTAIRTGRKAAASAIEPRLQHQEVGPHLPLHRLVLALARGAQHRRRVPGDDDRQPAPGVPAAAGAGDALAGREDGAGGG